jgi:AcrR family transcriptional regulator
VSEDAPAGRQDGDQTRHRILDAALALFGERGYEGTTVRDIANVAGVSDAAIYYYYPGKRELLDAILGRAMAVADEAAARVRDGEPMTEEELGGLALSMLDQLGEQNAAVKLLRRLAMNGDGEALRVRAERWAAWRAIMAARLATRLPHAEAEAAADALQTLMAGITFLAQLTFGTQLAARINDPAYRQDVVRQVLIAVPLEAMAREAKRA